MSKALCVVWLLLLLAGCGCGSERVVFQDVLKSDCTQPCWQGIIPASTKRHEVLELLGEPPDLDSGTLEWGDRCVDARYHFPQVTVGFDSEDTVESITLVDPDQQYMFQNAVNELGLPAVVLMAPCSPDSDKGVIYLVYPEQGLALGSSYVPTLGRPWREPSAETRVYQWVYFDPIASDLFQPKGKPIYGCGMPYANETSPWRGFGSD